MTTGTIYSISTSPERGQLKKETPKALLIENFGIENDGHAGDWGRQVTCLSWQSVEKINKDKHLTMGPGDYAENILIEGMTLNDLQAGDKLIFAETVILEITQIGKEDHPSIVSKTFGVSLLPFEGLFCKVIKGGTINKGDPVRKLKA
jgi:MOSC domain-containing protein YiiM